jgi:hypothetical protein
MAWTRIPLVLVSAGRSGRECLVFNIYIARVLRLLATHYIFTETSPDVFRNNRLSSMMDTLKSVDEIKAKYVF